MLLTTTSATSSPKRYCLILGNRVVEELCPKMTLKNLLNIIHQHSKTMKKIALSSTTYQNAPKRMCISLEGMTFHAYHGVLQQEREVGGEYKVDLRLYVDEEDAHEALYADRLEGTINYAEVYQLLSSEMQQPSLLLENVCARVCKSLIRAFRKLQEVEMKLTKTCPPIEGFSGQGASVEYSLKRKLVAWDFDGTIADTHKGIVRTMTATFQQMGFPLPSTEAICHTIGLPLTESIAQLAGLKMEEERLTEAVDLYRELFDEIGTGGVTLFPSVLEEMRRQHESGHFVAIATSRRHESVSAFCNQLGLSPYVDYIVAAEDVCTHKPHPEPIYRLCELSNVRPSCVTVIGDTTYDILMGRNAHVGTTVGVAWGNHSPQHLIDAGADYVVERF